jgi:integrase
MAVKVRERPKGSGEWWVFIDHQGKRKAKKIGKDKRFAQEVAKKIEARLTLGDVGITDEKQKSPLFKDYAELWLNGYIKGMRRNSTFVRYKDILTRYVYPALGNKPVDAIKRREIRDLLLKLHTKGLARATICLVRDVISGPLSFAHAEELIPVNPIMGITKRLQLRREKKTVVEPSTGEEVSRFLKTCVVRTPEYYPFSCAPSVPGCARENSWGSGGVTWIGMANSSWCKGHINLGA